MRLAVYYNNRDVRVEEFPRPDAGEGEMLVRVEASGICGSDVMEWYRLKKAPLVLGHEIAGVVEEAGKGVERFKKGDRVTVSHHVPCNTCRWCLNGSHSACDTLRATNFFPGGFSEYVRVPRINVDRGVFILPEAMTFEEASFAEPLGCVVRSFRLAGVSPGKGVAIIGSGISGLLHVKLAHAIGAGFIVSTDINAARLSWAKKFGADLSLNASEDVATGIKKTFGRLADAVFLCTADPKAISQALCCVDRGGTIVFFAPTEPDYVHPMPLFNLWRDNVTIKNTYASPPLDTMTALDLISSKRVTVKDMITHRLGLKDIQLGFRLTSEAKGSLKVVIEPHK